MIIMIATAAMRATIEYPASAAPRAHGFFFSWYRSSTFFT